MKRRGLALGMALVFTVMAVAGCGSSSSNPQKETAAGPKASEAEVPGTEVPEAEGTKAAEAAVGAFNLDEVKERNIILVERMGEQHIMGRTAAAFGDALEELSGGKITTTRYLNGEVETGATHPRDMYSSGVQDAGRIQLEMLNYYGFEKGNVYGLPYLFADREHFWKFAGSETGRQLLEDIAAQDWNYVPLVYIEEGARHFFTTKAMSSYKDLAGRKIRVQTSDIYVSMVEALGASATPMAWTEIYTALSTGVVDGAENPYSGYDSYLLNEVSPYILEDGHIFAGGTYGVRSSVWNDLNDTEKALFREAAQRASDFNQRQVEADEQAIKEKLKAAGVTILELSDTDRQELAELMKPLYEKYAGDYMDYIEEIQATNQ